MIKVKKAKANGKVTGGTSLRASRAPRVVEAVELYYRESGGLWLRQGVHESAKAALASGRATNKISRQLNLERDQQLDARPVTLAFPGGDVFATVELDFYKAAPWRPTHVLEVPLLAGRSFSEQSTEWQYDPGELVMTTRAKAFKDAVAFNRHVLKDFAPHDSHSFPWRIVIEFGEDFQPCYGSFQLGGEVGTVDLCYVKTIRVVHPTKAEIERFGKGGAQ